MSMFSSFMHPERGYQAAQDELNKYYNQAQGYQQPYNQHGQDAYEGLGSAMQALLNPQELQDKWSSGYKESEYAKMAEEMAKQHGLDAASSMGLLGSTPALQALQAGTAQIGLQDRQNYMNDLLQKYLAGTGIGQNIYNIGANSASQMGQNALNMGQNSAQMRFNGTNAPGNLFGNLLGTGASLVGGAFGGPIGSALGAGLSQKMGWSPNGSYNPHSGGY